MTIKGTIAVVVVMLMVFAVVAGFRLVGTPEHRRRVADDKLRTAELRSIVAALRQKTSAPATLPKEVRRLYYAGAPLGAREFATSGYAYRRLDTHRFELCATFLERSGKNGPDGEDMYEWYDAASPRYAHGAGRTCYRYDLHDKSSRS